MSQIEPGNDQDTYEPTAEELEIEGKSTTIIVLALYL